VNSPLPGQSAGFYFSGTTDPAIFGNTLTAGIVGAPTMLTGAMPASYTKAVLTNWLQGGTDPIVGKGPDTPGSAPSPTWWERLFGLNPGKLAGTASPELGLVWNVVIAVLAVGVVWIGIKVLTGGGK
jgi:hypothetical protein